MLIQSGPVQIPGDASPGEVQPKFASSTKRLPCSPGELTPGELEPVPAGSGRVVQVFSRPAKIGSASAEGNASLSFGRDPPSTRSLHTSDLLPENSERRESALRSLPSAQEPAKSLRSQDEDKDAEQELESIKSQSSIPKTHSIHGEGDRAGHPSWATADLRVRPESASSGSSNKESEMRARSKGSEPKAPTRIEVMMPSVDLHESSVASEGQFDIEGDETTGDISSISGGDF